MQVILMLIIQFLCCIEIAFVVEQRNQLLWIKEGMGAP